MNFAEIYERVKSLIMNTSEDTGVSAECTEDGGLNLIGLNSISFIKLVVLIENEFGIEFDDEDLDVKKFTGFNDVISYIQHRIQ